MKVLLQKEFEAAKDLFDFLQKEKPTSVGIIVSRENKIVSMAENNIPDMSEDVYVFIVKNLRGVYYGKLLFLSRTTGKVENSDKEFKEVLVLNKEIILEPEYILFEVETDDYDIPKYLIYCESIYANIDEDGKPKKLNMIEPN